MYFQVSFRQNDYHSRKQCSQLYFRHFSNHSKSNEPVHMLPATLFYQLFNFRANFCVTSCADRNWRVQGKNNSYTMKQETLVCFQLPFSGSNQTPCYFSEFISCSISPFHSSASKPLNVWCTVVSSVKHLPQWPQDEWEGVPHLLIVVAKGYLILHTNLLHHRIVKSLRAFDPFHLIAPSDFETRFHWTVHHD